MKIRLQRFYYPTILAILLVAVLVTGCDKEEFNTSPDFRLAFSTDTVSFDTIFQSIGSATQIMKVYNRSDEFVTIDRISVIDSCDTYDPFRINVDGISGDSISESVYSVSDVEIGPNDSAFIFVEVTIDPNALNQMCSALQIGVLEFLVNGNRQYVTLFAFGQDANFFIADTIDEGKPFSPPIKIIDPSGASIITWTPDKPYVIYGYARVETGQKLIIQPGTQVYFHQGSGLWVDAGASIEVGGESGEAVVFQGDRLEEFFDEEPGQWDRIWINGDTENNTFTNTIIKNNFIGIQVEPSPYSENSNSLVSNRLILKNVAIRNNSVAGIFSRNYRIEAENLLVSAGGQHCLAATGAGQYRFDHCTFANNWSASTRQTPAVFLTNLYPVDSQTLGVGNILNSRFRNCIFYGNGLNEFGFDFETASASIDLSIDHTLIRMQEDDFLELDQSYFADEIFVGFDPGFVNFSGGDFRLREDAFVRSKGTSLGGLPNFDIVGTPYNNPRPLGCFEYPE
ncbi:MAG: hypothetical protein WBG42_07340 [Cryomorphaceae bacterium]